jgi:hypothetical protein
MESLEGVEKNVEYITKSFKTCKTTLNQMFQLRKKLILKNFAKRCSLRTAFQETSMQIIKLTAM